MKEKHEVLRTLTLILQIGITMMVTFGLCFMLGLFLDRQLGTKLLWVFIILGILSGYRAVYLLIRRYIRSKVYDREQPDWAKRAFGESAGNQEISSSSDQDSAGESSGENAG